MEERPNSCFLLYNRRYSWSSEGVAAPSGREGPCQASMCREDLTPDPFMKRLFLHGLDSSGFGTKGRYFAETYPDMLRPDFDGSLADRMERLHAIVADLSDLLIVGSSFGGLMATCLAKERPSLIKRLVLLAPALNFKEYQPPPTKLTTQTVLVIGRHDTVTPPDIVVPAAESTFARLETVMVDDDHLLHDSFRQLDWDTLLA